MEAGEPSGREGARFASVPGPRRLALAAAAAVAALLAAMVIFDLGPFADRLSREELIAAGDRICADAHKAFSESQRHSPQTARQAEELTRGLLEIAEDELDEIDGLRAPEELEDPLDAYLESRRPGIARLRDGVKAADDGDGDAYEDARAALAADQSKRRRLAREVGFRDCSRPLRRGS